MNHSADSEQAPPATVDANAVLAERVSHLYSQLPIGIALTFVIGALATYELWELELSQTVILWWGLVLVVTVASAGLYLAYRRAGRRHARQALAELARDLRARDRRLLGSRGGRPVPLNSNEDACS
jgi:hypothetical protein